MPIGRIQLKHGKEESADFGSMLEAEVYYATDTERVMISKGDGTGHYLPSKSEVDEINNRIDDVIATPVPTGEAVAQEIIDSRQGAVSLGANLTSIKNTKADKVEITTHNTSETAHGDIRLILNEKADAAMVNGSLAEIEQDVARLDGNLINLDNEKKFNVSLEIFQGEPRLRIEEVI